VDTTIKGIEMKEISKNIMKIYESEDGIDYVLNCSRCSEDHLTRIEIEHSRDIPNEVTVSFHKTMVWTSQWGDIHWIFKLWKRIKASFTMLFTGWIDVEEYVILEDEEHIDNLIIALEEGKKKVREYLDK
jgi:hypothetical protein